MGSRRFSLEAKASCKPSVEVIATYVRIVSMHPRGKDASGKHVRHCSSACSEQLGPTWRDNIMQTVLR